MLIVCSAAHQQQYFVRNFALKGNLNMLLPIMTTDIRIDIYDESLMEK